LNFVPRGTQNERNMGRKYKIKAAYIIEGYYEVEANSKKEAQEIVLNNSSIWMRFDIKTTGEKITDYEFSMSPDLKLK
jgi:hypothetical protein